jgi:hypothetical protein
VVAAVRPGPAVCCSSSNARERPGSVVMAVPGVSGVPVVLVVTAPPDPAAPMPRGR